MKLLQALEIAQICDLDTVGEAIYNIRLHAISLFSYDELASELNELTEDSDAICAGVGICDETTVAEAIKKITSQNLKG